MPNEKNSFDSLTEATAYRAEKSGHGPAKGAAGYKEQNLYPDSEFLSSSGQFAIIDRQDDGYGPIRIGAAWDNIKPEPPQRKTLLSRFIKPKHAEENSGVDIDLGCLYELADGTRG